MGQNPAHYYGLTQLVRWANGVFGEARVRMQGPISLTVPDNVYSEPEPDLAVTREESSQYASRHHGPGELLLIVEVSDTTLRTDVLVRRAFMRAREFRNIGPSI